METLLVLVVWALMGFWCYKIAEKRNRNKGLAAVLGVLFGIFAVLGYYIAGEKKVDNTSTK